MLVAIKTPPRILPGLFSNPSRRTIARWMVVKASCGFAYWVSSAVGSGRMFTRNHQGILERFRRTCYLFGFSPYLACSAACLRALKALLSYATYCLDLNSATYGDKTMKKCMKSTQPCASIEPMTLCPHIRQTRRIARSTRTVRCTLSNVEIIVSTRQVNDHDVFSMGNAWGGSHCVW